MCTENKLKQEPFLGFGHNWAPKPVGVKCHRIRNKSFFRNQKVENTMCTKNELDQKSFLGFGHNWAPKPVGVKSHRMSE